MNVVVKKASLADLPEILRLNSALFEKEYAEFDDSLDRAWTKSRKGRKFFKDMIVNRACFTAMATIDGKTAGYLCGRLFEQVSFRKAGIYAELENMMVEKPLQNKGVGTALANEFIAWCRKKRVDYLSVQLSAQNKQAHDFYKSLSFDDYDIKMQTDFKKL